MSKIYNRVQLSLKNACAILHWALYVRWRCRRP